MTQQEKMTELKGTSPRGVFKYPHLTAPDYGTKEHPIEGGAYNTRLVVSAGVAEAFVAKLQPLIDVAMAEADEKFAALKAPARNKLGSVTWNDVAMPVYDSETEEETGDFEFRFKTKASGKTAKGKKWERKLPLFDAKGTPIKNLAAVWGGSEGKASFIARPYFIPATGAAGVSLYLEAAQIIKLIAGRDGASAEDHGFGEEVGYEADNAPFEADVSEGGYEAPEDSDTEENEDF